ncbi:DegQ family serine endoprotease [Desulforhopalus singaporensis]|uniref:Probable periplasmic serine endoprotease DegP-like n=1 Tax=Desulforhopalus singaporensis TaxID=91360 RepID=A0A1H0S7A1_9BACT|nr:DegQ family serine endoprotease [Desulforhopalus singaporensis]SDP37106.1 serine protease Do [Desulforhopalus singaporensis]
MKTSNSPRTIRGLLIVVTALFVFGAGIGAANSSTDGDSAILERYSKAFVNVVKKAKPAVVHIRVEKTTTRNYQGLQGLDEMFNHPFFEQFFGPQFRQQLPKQREFKQRGQGSGFIISKNGFILTNNHVVAGADVIKVALADEREFTAKVVGTDPQTDVALIKIDDPENLPVLPLGDSAALEAGEWVIAIGNPFGLSQTVTVGVVSATGRSSIGINEYENFIQTDAAINPGNSGGPLLNGAGEVVGINTALFSRTGGYMGIGFAIPINMAKSIEKQLQEHGKVTRGWLGVAIQDVTKDLAESFGLKQAGGILVSQVQDDSPASAAGLQQGDVIVRLDNHKLADVSDLRNRIAMLQPGTKVLLHIIRDGREKKIQVTISEQPADMAQNSAVPASENSLEKYGLAVQELTDELAEKFGYETGSGLIVSDVAPESPAALAGLNPGVLIEEVNRKPVSSFEDLDNILKESGQTNKILLRVRIKGYSSYVVLSAK